MIPFFKCWIQTEVSTRIMPRDRSGAFELAGAVSRTLPTELAVVRSLWQSMPRDLGGQATSSL